MRLWVLIPCAVYAALGYMLYGWGAQTGAHWITIAIGVGAMISHQVGACAIATAYAMECFPGVSLAVPASSCFEKLTSCRSPESLSSSWPCVRRWSTSRSRTRCSPSLTPPGMAGRFSSSVSACWPRWRRPSRSLNTGSGGGRGSLRGTISSWRRSEGRLIKLFDAVL